MRRTVNILGLIAMVMGTMWVYGCGEADLLDELGQNYRGTLTVLENGDGSLQVDVTRDPDCNDDGTLDDPEPFSDALGEIEVIAATNTAGLTLQYYTIAYIPLYSVDITGVNQMPPDLTDPGSSGETIMEIPPASTVSFSITLMSTDSKAEYVIKMASDPALVNLGTSRYIIRVGLHFEDQYGNDQDMTIERTVYLGHYDNC